MPAVKEQLRNIGIGGMTVSSVSGWSRKRELHLQWRGQPVSYDLVPRMKFESQFPTNESNW
jgi:nitrogen regulatory protein P-II 1